MKSKLEEYISRAEQQLEGKRTLLGKMLQLKAQNETRIENLQQKGKVEDLINIRLEQNTLVLAIEQLEGEISETEASIKNMSRDAERQAREAHLVSLGKEASSNRVAYEVRLVEIQQFLEQKAPEMMRAYQKWQSCSREFNNLLSELVPGIGSFDPDDSLRELCDAFLGDIQSQGVDLPSCLSWNFALVGNRHFQLPDLPGRYWSALDRVQELAMYGGNFFSQKSRDTFGMKGSIGPETELPLRRPYFPLMSEDRKSYYLINVRKDSK